MVRLGSDKNKQFFFISNFRYVQFMGQLIYKQFKIALFRFILSKKHLTDGSFQSPGDQNELKGRLSRSSQKKSREQFIVGCLLVLCLDSV